MAKPRVPKPRKAKVSVTWSDAEAVRKIAKPMIYEHHAHLLTARVEFLFRSRHAKSKRKPLMGRTILVTGLNSFLALGEPAEAHKNLLNEKDEAPEKFFCCEVALDLWQELDDNTKTALVDHLLSFAGREGENLFIAAPDVSAFTAVVRRRGLWEPDVAALAKAIGQPSLKLEEGGATEPPKPEDDGVVSPDAEPQFPSEWPLLHWVTTLAMEEQTLPLREGPEPVLVVEVGTGSYKALVDKLGEQDGMVFLLGTHGPKDKRCLVQHVPGASDWPGLVVEAPVVEKPKRARSKK